MLQQIKTEIVFSDEEVSDEERAYYFARFIETLDRMNKSQNTNKK